MSAPNPGTKLIGSNKNARRNYEVLDTFEAGISLMGSEVKSLREGRVSFKDGYVRLSGGEAWLVGVHIAPYEQASYFGHEPERERKLLLHGYEIDTLAAKVEQKGLSVVPLKMYFKKGRVKVEIALCRGKKIHDRREDLKARDIQRDTARELARFK
ncbi:SsrA-binding protein SmpB [Desulfocurvus sp. DL9XJH121]